MHACRPFLPPCLVVAAWSFFACFNSACMLVETHPKFRAKQPDSVGGDIPRSAFAAAGSNKPQENGSSAAHTNGAAPALAQAAPAQAMPDRQVHRSRTSARPGSAGRSAYLGPGNNHGGAVHIPCTLHESSTHSPAHAPCACSPCSREHVRREASLLAVRCRRGCRKVTPGNAECPDVRRGTSAASTLT